MTTNDNGTGITSFRDRLRNDNGTGITSFRDRLRNDMEQA